MERGKSDTFFSSVVKREEERAGLGTRGPSAGSEEVALTASQDFWEKPVEPDLGSCFSC